MPRTFQARLTATFVTVLALTLVLVTVLVINRLDDYFTRQGEADLGIRSATIGTFVRVVADDVAKQEDTRVVSDAGLLDPDVVAAFGDPGVQRLIADQLGRADVLIRFGRTVAEGEGFRFIAAPNGSISIESLPSVQAGQRQETGTALRKIYGGGSVWGPYAVEVTLSKPYTFRSTALANLTGLLAAIALFALGMSIVVAAILARRFTTPLRRLTEASRGLAEGDLSRRVPAEEVRAGSAEIAELAIQFNAMADRVEESVELIRRDRDRSRDFLADVSHELRTPIAALRMFNELLSERAGEDPETRTEFLESSGQQIERLDWLAQNLLELSKLDSGLVLLDLRPDDVRAAVESAVEQAESAAMKRGVRLELRLPDRPLRIRHDPQRIGQVVANLVANGVKFTPRGGSVTVEVSPADDGVRIDVSDTGVGIESSEMPRIFDRFYRGTRANEARGSGSGLGLAIVRSIVDMHGGSIVVESRVGAGSRFSVLLPSDPRLVAGTPAAERADVASAKEARERRDREAGDAVGSGSAVTGIADAAGGTDGRDGVGKVAETSPSEEPRVNPRPAP
jgi:signal transduction histidine kinase